MEGERDGGKDENKLIMNRQVQGGLLFTSVSALEFSLSFKITYRCIKKIAKYMFIKKISYRQF